MKTEITNSIQFNLTQKYPNMSISRSQYPIDLGCTKDISIDGVEVRVKLNQNLLTWHPLTEEQKHEMYMLEMEYAK